jgi:hypothetical protein
MPDPSTLRDSTQIVLPSDALVGLRDDLTEKFTLTLYEMDVVIRDGSEAPTEDEDRSEMPTEDYVRIIGSPVEIKAASDFLSRHGVSLR